LIPLNKLKKIKEEYDRGYNEGSINSIQTSEIIAIEKFGRVLNTAIKSIEREHYATQTG